MKVTAKCQLCEKEAIVFHSYANRYVCDDCKSQEEKEQLKNSMRAPEWKI